MIMEQNFLAEAINSLGMSANGIIIGVLSSAISLFYVNNNSLSRLSAIGALVSGAVVGAICWEYMSLKEWSKPAVSAATFLAGYMSSDLLASIKSASPTITNYFVKKYVNRIKKNDK